MGKHATEKKTIDVEQARKIQSVCDEFALAFRESPATSIEWYLDRIDPNLRETLLIELIATHADFRKLKGEAPTVAEYAASHPELAGEIEERLAFLISSRVSFASTRNSDESQVGLALPPPEAHLDRYEIRSRLGRGGFGEVWEAYDPLLDRLVAVKVLRRSKQRSAADADALIKEARKLASLNHDQVVRILDAGIAGERVFFVSELMTGVTLAHRLKKGRVPVATAVDWMTTIAKALHHAHERDSIHRDIKPSNILFDSEGVPHLADFGLAASAQELIEEERGTAGTIHYMSPEQAAGDNHLVTRRSDIYSLGVVLHEMLTGALPPSRETVGVSREHGQPAPARVFSFENADVTPELEEACRKALAIDPSRRFATALEFADALQSCVSHEAQPPRQSNRRWWLIGGFGGALVAILLAGIALRPKPEETFPGNRPVSFGREFKDLIVYGAYDSNEPYGYNPITKSFDFNANSYTAIRAGSDQGGWLEAEVDLSIDSVSDIAAAGLFWGLQRGPDGHDFGWNIRVEKKYGTEDEHQVVFNEFTLQEQSGGTRGILGTKTPLEADEIPVPLNSLSRFRLRIQVRGPEIKQVWVNGVTLLPDDPIVLSAPEWWRPENSIWGVIGNNGDVSIHALERF